MAFGKQRHIHKGEVVDSQIVSFYKEDWLTGKVYGKPVKVETTVTARCDQCLNLFQVVLQERVIVPKGMEISK